MMRSVASTLVLQPGFYVQLKKSQTESIAGLYGHALPARDRRKFGGGRARAVFSPLYLTRGGCVAWIVRLVKIGADGEEPLADVIKINRPDDLDDIANLGLTVADGKRVLAGLQQEIVAAQAGSHSVRRPECRSCGGVCHVKDHRNHAVATHLGQVMVRLPRFRCAGCGAIEAGIGWPSHCR